jgi:S-adenosylmethionine uptake transporter
MTAEPGIGAPQRPILLGRSAGWLLLDLALVTTMQATVKAEGQPIRLFNSFS